MYHLSLYALLLTANPNDRLQYLVERNRELIEQVNTLEAEVKAVVSKDGGQTWGAMSRTVIWRKNGDQQRFIITSQDGEGREGAKTRHIDAYVSPGKSLVLNGWDPAKVPRLPLSPRDGFNGIIGSIKQGPRSLAQYGAPFWLFFLADPGHNLAELARIARHKKYIGKVDIGGAQAEAIELTAPANNITYTFYLSPEMNFAVRRRIMQVPAFQKNPASTGVHDVLEFQEIKPGVFLPVHVRNTPGRLEVGEILDIHAKYLKVNEPLPEGDLEVKFPQGALVRDFNGKNSYIWGRDGPEKVFANNQELLAWELDTIAKEDRQANQRTWFLPISLALFALIACLLVLRRIIRRSNLRASSTPR